LAESTKGHDPWRFSSGPARAGAEGTAHINQLMGDPSLIHNRSEQEGPTQKRSQFRVAEQLRAIKVVGSIGFEDNSRTDPESPDNAYDKFE